MEHNKDDIGLYELEAKPNVGKIDRTIRVIIGVGIIAVGIYFQSGWGVIGAIPILTGVRSWCPLYAPFGISTCKK